MLTVHLLGADKRCVYLCGVTIPACSGLYIAELDGATKSCIALAKYSRRMPIFFLAFLPKMNVRASVPEHDHPLGGRSSYCYGRAYHHSSRTQHLGTPTSIGSPSYVPRPFPLQLCDSLSYVGSSGSFTDLLIPDLIT
ncbi:jg12483 [Pararge aegeria aegeria]|uniref:Jg12483 protein n=1 Tax=Pararge aegeria aegeria TaxID=348720 RepID=A0A8S4S626_9NEOP|nr:jg12483 [Pararge aegeria aegeria]